MKRLLIAILFASTAPALTVRTQPAAVRVWAGSLEIPTYGEGPASENPPFELFTFGRINYPYPIRDALTGRSERVTWRTLHLENEYLRLTVLPDLGGHVYRCLDKRNGREMFYANSAIKKALIGYRGAWAAFGVEFNFPVSHNWVSMSPVDFATRTNADGSASIVVANTDRVYGGRWRVELRLRPARAALEQTVDLYNTTNVRHRYYWWSNAAVRAWEDSRLVYPTELMATHGFTSIEPWPVDREGRDMSVIRNQVDGPVSLFTYATREGFVGVYHPQTGSGTVHVADPAELPVHKVWSWGNDRDAAAWRSALSDDDSRYVELQAGLFRNQETYAFLEPQASVHFAETWVPVRDLGGITRANGDAVLHMERTGQGRMRIAVDVTRDLPGHIRIRQGPAIHVDRDVALSAREVWRAEVDAASTPMTFELTDASGRALLRHVENAYDRTPASAVRTGRQPDLRPAWASPPSAGDVVALGERDELEGRRLSAMARYAKALQQYPNDGALLKAAGRLAVALGWPDSGGDVRPQAFGASPVEAPARELSLEWLTRAHAVNPTDFEAEYYLGAALAAAGRRQDARPHLESAMRFSATRIPAALELARLRAVEGGLEAALGIVREGLPGAPLASTLGALEVSLLRRLDRRADASDRVRYWQSVDPADTAIRFERVMLGDEDPELWTHLAADASRVLDLADACLRNGTARDALTVLEHAYPDVPPAMREPGAVLPRESALVGYYRAHVRMLLGGRFALDPADMRSRSTRYVFPSRRSSHAVLVSALQADPGDQTARFLIGSLYLSGGLTAQAITEWQRARTVDPAIPTLHRNLALALIHGPGDLVSARTVLEEGLRADPRNADLYLTLDGVLSAAGAPAAERAAALRRYPAQEALPMLMLSRMALALAEQGQAAEAEGLFKGRYFPREEGGTNVRTVYAQVRLASARFAAASGNCAAARGIVDALAAEQPELSFTAGGLSDVLQAPPMALQLASIQAACGRAAVARAVWQRLAQPLASGGPPMTIALGVEARRRLGMPLQPADRRRIEEALASANQTLDRAESSNPGAVEHARALLLAALGRRADSQRALERAFMLPDRNLSHAIARAVPPRPPAGRR